MDEVFRRAFYYPEDLEIFDAETETGIIESQEAMVDFINQRESANTNKQTAILMYTCALIRCMEANSIKNEKTESFLVSELDHLLSKKQSHIINNLLI